MPYIYIRRNLHGGINIHDEYHHEMTYYFYTRREALKLFCEQFGYTRKKLNIIKL